MRTLVYEDDYVTGVIMNEILSDYGQCDVAVNGKDGIEKFIKALDENQKYDLIFMDIMMPGMTGQEVVTKIRSLEKDRGICGLECVKIYMNTALDDYSNIMLAFKNQVDGYLIKPIEKDKLTKLLIEQKFINA
jgi:two-component system chemotaxis response regulator CheY